MKDTSNHLKPIRRRYRLFRSIEILLWSAAISYLVFFPLKVFTLSDILPIVGSCVVGCISAIAGIGWVQLFTTNDNTLALYLNRNYPTLRESADLLLKKEDELTHLQQLQRIRTISQFEEIYPSIKIPHHIGRAAGVLAFGLIAGITATSFLSPSGRTTSLESDLKENTQPGRKNLPSGIRDGAITISPPSYTQLEKKITQDFNLEIPEGSLVAWSISFDAQASIPQLIISGRDTIPFAENGKDYILRRTFNEGGFYQLTWKNGDVKDHYSDYYKLKVVDDAPPSIVIENLNQFVELIPGDALKINFTSILTDDYGVGQAHIIATVSKGSGEAIKFREQKLAFDTPKKISGKRIHASKTIDLANLGLSAGDELYFYIEAFDFKAPDANRARTETYFIALKDTAEMITTVEASLGVDLMPEYFRSQRQIIVDSEKLLREKKRIPKQDFNERSNVLAHDEKVLRLRYGEFLGEEFESGIGPQHAVRPSAAEGEEDLRKRFGHQHDRENSVDPAGKISKAEEHEHARSKTEDSKEDPLEEFVHAHDSEEEATFFVQSIRAKLRAALAIMWDAELYLSLYQPEKSLPYQYKALNLLKEISQDSRIYVHRTGFDPPPLKEEKRLTGDLSEIENSVAKSQQGQRDETHKKIRLALTTIENVLDGDSVSLSEVEKSILMATGRDLAAMELKKPGTYLKTLSDLKMITQDEMGNDESRNILLNIRSSLWNALPHQAVHPQASSGITHELDLELLKSLEKSNLNP